MFGRRSSSQDAGAQQVEESLDSASGKGRATPKRKDAEAARKKMMTPPRNKREANALHRERVREQRVKQRQALSGGGDDRYLPARDQGPVKRYVRDYVDSHRTIGEFLIPIFIAVLIVGILLESAVPNAPYAASLPWVVVLAVLVVDSMRILRGVRAGITERFGEKETQGITFYTLMRSWQMRRLRLPKARVRAGDSI